MTDHRRQKPQEMSLTEEDFDTFFGEVLPASYDAGIQHLPGTRTVRIRRPETFVSQITEDEIKDDSLPPWRSEDRNGNRYLHVWEQDNPIQS